MTEYYRAEEFIESVEAERETACTNRFCDLMSGFLNRPVTVCACGHVLTGEPDACDVCGAPQKP